MAIEGVIAERVRARIPVALDALEDDDARIPDGTLESTVETVNEALFGEVLEEDQLADLPLRVIDYAAKLVSIEFLATAIDFFANMPVAERTITPDEQTTYTNRANEYRQLRKELIDETRAEKNSILAAIRVATGYMAPSSSAPRLSSIGDELLTPSPQDFGRPYAQPTR